MKKPQKKKYVNRIKKNKKSSNKIINNKQKIKMKKRKQEMKTLI